MGVIRWIRRLKECVMDKYNNALGSKYQKLYNIGYADGNANGFEYGIHIGKRKRELDWESNAAWYNNVLRSEINSLGDKRLEIMKTLVANGKSIDNGEIDRVFDELYGQYYKNVLGEITSCITKSILNPSDAKE